MTKNQIESEDLDLFCLLFFLEEEEDPFFEVFFWTSCKDSFLKAAH
jgi:hypothetical protein